MNKCIRHGEAMLVPVDKEFKGRRRKRFIIAHSETGHHHVLESDKAFKISQKDEEFLIELFEPGRIVHQKAVDTHKTLPVPAGKYKVVQKTEYDPWQSVVREVFD